MIKNNSLISLFARRSRLILGRFGIGNQAERMSAGLSALMDDLSDKNVAIIGNSRALSGQEYGAEIDAAEIIIRINRAPMPAAISHGTRTDWLALATSLARSSYHSIRPRRLLWMSHKRKRLRAWVVETPGFYLHSTDRFQQLSDELASSPTTGLIIIDLVAKSDARAANIYGFDFFASQSLTGSRTAAQVPHDFGSEKLWVRALIERDARFQLNS